MYDKNQCKNTNNLRKQKRVQVQRNSQKTLILYDLYNK